jgi:hypothetical protein
LKFGISFRTILLENWGTENILYSYNLKFMLPIFLFWQYLDLKSGLCALLVRCSPIWVTPPEVCVNYFTNKILFMPRHLAPTFSYLHFLYNWKYRNKSPYLTVGWDGVLGTFWLSRPWTKVLTISASWVARIIYMDSYVQLLYPFYKDKA